MKDKWWWWTEKYKQELKEKQTVYNKNFAVLQVLFPLFLKRRKEKLPKYLNLFKTFHATIQTNPKETLLTWATLSIHSVSTSEVMYRVMSTGPHKSHREISCLLKNKTIFQNKINKEKSSLGSWKWQPDIRNDNHGHFSIRILPVYKYHNLVTWLVQKWFF